MTSVDAVPAPPRRFPAAPLAGVCLASFAFLLDTTVVTVALPDIGRSFAAGVDVLSWVPDVYTLVLAVLMLPLGAVSDRTGPQRALQCGLVIFVVASAGCALAPGLAWLLVARAVQGVGGAAIAVAGFALVLAVYDGDARSRAIGVLFAVNGLGAALGPIVGGTLTEYLGWRAIFWLNVPLVVLAVVLLGRDRRRVPTAPFRLDAAGTALFAVVAIGLTAGLSEAPGRGWGAPTTWLPLAVAVLALPAFLARQARASRPLVDLTLFRRARFTAAMTGVAVSSIVFAALIYTSVWLQDGLGLGALRAGLALTPFAAATFVTSLAGGRMLAGVSPQRLLGTGLVVVAGGLALQVAAMGPSPWTLAPGLAVAGVGFGVAGPAMGRAVAAATPAARAGSASGLMATLRQLGQTLGVAALAIPFTGAPAEAAAGTGSGAGPARGLAGASGLATVDTVAAGIAAVAGALALLTARREGDDQADSV